jgi:hypothetical protein
MTLLLAVVVSFLVVDGSDRPMAGAEVCHTAKRIIFPKTGADGRIKIDTDAPRVVVRMEGYRSEVVPLRAGKAKVRVVLRRPALVPICRLARELHSGWPSQLRHGYGPNNGKIQPSNSAVWNAAEYTETNLELNGRPAIDAKSTSADGRRSRYFGNLSESITYDDVDADTAHQFDRIIERACQTHVTAQVDGKDVFVSPVNVARDTARVPDGGVYEGYTSSSILVFRRLGYRSVVVKPAEGLRIEMEPVSPWPFKTCPRKWNTGGSVIFQFPGRGPDWPFRDVDYSGSNYIVKTRSGDHYLRHGYGPLWSGGTPSNYLIHPSTKYEEQTYSFGESQIAAARGRLADGTIWRFLGRFAETASYETKDPEAAKQLDAILDGVCLTEPAP